MAKKNQELNNDTKTILTVVLLFLFYPAGLVLMYKWMDWPKWLKILVTVPVLFFFLWIFGILATVMLVAINPQAQIDKGRMYQQQKQQMMYSPTPASNYLYK